MPTAMSVIIVLLLLLLQSSPFASATSICVPGGNKIQTKCQFRPIIMSTLTFPRGGGGSKSKFASSSSSSSVSSVSSSSISTNSNTSLLLSPLRSFIQLVSNARSHLIAAACARAISIVTMYPIDTIKTRLQMTQSTAFRLTGLYKGVVGSLVGQVPYGVLTFGSYEIYKQILHERFPTIASTQPAIIYVASAILGDITGSGWLCPSEVIKQQLQAGIYTNTLDAIRGIYSSTGGGLKGFYKGYTGGLARDVPFRVAQLTTFEITKRFYLRTKQQQQRQQCAGSSSSRSGKSSTTEESESLSALEAAACGAIAGSFSAAITNPLDRIKTLMMTDVTNVYGGSVFTCAQKMVRNDGLIGGLFTGVIPRVVYIAPSVCIFFVTYELVQQKLMTPTKKR